jgi:hypothetical protein
MGVTQHHGINASGIKGKWMLVPAFVLVPTLDQTTIQQQALRPRCDHVTGTGHLAGSTKELNIYGHETFLRTVDLRLQYPVKTG